MSNHDILNEIIIDHYSPVPLFFQIFSEINRLLRAGILKPKTALPTEKDFCEKFNISRVTIRRAMAELEKEHLIYRIRAKGTFIEENIDNVYSKSDYGWLPITTSIEASGKKAHAELISLKYDYPSIEIQKQLNISNSKKISILKRLYYADGIPHTLNYFYLIEKIEWNLEKLSEVQSLTYYLDQYHNISTVNTLVRITAEQANRDCVNYLKLRIKDPVLKVIGINRGLHGEMIGGDCSFHKANKTTVSLRINKYSPAKWIEIL